MSLHVSGSERQRTIGIHQPNRQLLHDSGDPLCRLQPRLPLRNVQYLDQVDDLHLNFRSSVFRRPQNHFYFPTVCRTQLVNARRALDLRPLPFELSHSLDVEVPISECGVRRAVFDIPKKERA